MNNRVYIKYDVRVFDKFIDKFAQKYIEQRSTGKIPSANELLQAAESLGSGFDLAQIKSIIQRNSVAVDAKRDEGKETGLLTDIYRSDLGELLTAYYFEEKLGDAERYIIPAKNISTRERYDMPGRGVDIIGYKINESGEKELLLAEAKVSHQKANPPAVVDSNHDSLYNSLKNYHDNLETVQQRLIEYSKNLSGKDFTVILCFIICIEKNIPIDITYGCGLVRDYTCVDDTKDYGKMRSNADEFAPGNIHFTIFSFTEETIDTTIDLFYKRVKELTQ